MAKVFSLTTVTMVIDNPTKGTITIGGAGKLVGQVAYSYKNELFSMDDTPDGGYVASFNGSKAGTISLTLKQTSSHIVELVDFITWCRENPALAMSKITISDTLGNIACVGNGAFPKAIPANQVGETAGDRGFEFAVGEIISEERNV